MARVLTILQYIFNAIFVTNYYGGARPTVFSRLISYIVSKPYLIFGVCLVLIGFVISVVKRIIHS